MSIIGHIDCPHCGAECKVKESKTRRWATYTCNACGGQYFSRSAKSDELLRLKMRPLPTEDETPLPPKPEPDPEPKAPPPPGGEADYSAKPKWGW